MIEAAKIGADEKAMLAALKEFKAANGHPAMRELLQNVAGVGTASEVPASKRDVVIAACKKAPAVPPRFDSLDSLSKAVWDKRRSK